MIDKVVKAAPLLIVFYVLVKHPEVVRDLAQKANEGIAQLQAALQR